MACQGAACVVIHKDFPCCSICGKNTKSGHSKKELEKNYQKQVDPPAADYSDEECQIPQDPIPHPKPMFNTPIPPLITYTSTMEYRVTSEVRGKPGNVPGLQYIMNHYAMERSDVEKWVEKKKLMAERNESWSYKQILPDHRWDDDKEKSDKKSKECEKPQAIQICICSPADSKKVEKTESKKEEKKEVKKEEGGVLSTPSTKASCLPMGGGGGGQCPQPVKMMLCLPCPPPCPEGQGQGQKSKACPKSSKKPKDYTYRCESRELRGGNLYTCCQCNKRNGLQHDCPRTPCQGRPACLQKPWPDCWPSGGCHGIDFSRESGVKRYDPCREQRFDNKQCNPPSSKAAKSECGGNMMVVVCPQGGR